MNSTSILKKLFRSLASRRRLARHYAQRTLAQDAGEHWITVNAGSKTGGEGGGAHVLLDGEGRVLAGMGGKFKGQHIDRIERKKFINSGAWSRQKQALSAKGGNSAQLKRDVTSGLGSPMEEGYSTGVHNALTRRAQRANKGLINVLHDRIDRMTSPKQAPASNGHVESIAQHMKDASAAKNFKGLKARKALREQLDALPVGTFISPGGYTIEKTSTGWNNGGSVRPELSTPDLEAVFKEGKLHLGIGTTPEEAKNSVTITEIYDVHPQQAPKVEAPKDYSKPVKHEDGHTSASTSDINENLAKQAYYWTSFDPNARGERVLQEYAQRANSLYDRLKAQVKNPEQQVFLNEAFENAKQKLKGAYEDALRAESNCASAYVTGPARYNSGKQAANFKRANNAWEEVRALTDKLEENLSKGILRRNTPEALQRANDQPYLTKIAEIQSAMASKEGYRANLYKNELYKSLEAKARSGKVEELDRLMQAVQHAKIFTDKHKVWQLPEMARKRAEKNATNATTQGHSYKGVNIVRNTDINRLQMKFDNKPTSEQIQDLKGSGWRWSPRYQAWQRQITDNAERSMHKFLSTHFKADV